jgi:hypothetical protein
VVGVGSVNDDLFVVGCYDCSVNGLSLRRSSPPRIFYDITYSKVGTNTGMNTVLL